MLIQLFRGAATCCSFIRVPGAGLECGTSPELALLHTGSELVCPSSLGCRVSYADSMCSCVSVDSFSRTLLLHTVLAGSGLWPGESLYTNLLSLCFLLDSLEFQEIFSWVSFGEGGGRIMS